MLAQRTRGFLYYVSLTGVTGARSALPQLAIVGDIETASVVQLVTRHFAEWRDDGRAPPQVLPAPPQATGLQAHAIASATSVSRSVKPRWERVGAEKARAIGLFATELRRHDTRAAARDVRAGMIPAHAQLKGQGIGR